MDRPHWSPRDNHGRKQNWTTSPRPRPLPPPPVFDPMQGPMESRSMVGVKTTPKPEKKKRKRKRKRLVHNGLT
ncbi:hypothetical protein BO70DRAFT_358784 [Aspergillus heteromorphus CBS 117.55]|uniref:Uncharacterized protein n=1 Tax=Aspergillus heteromorphus CBS 117.55 TaxID=1448321 RepID=A0A317WVB5_9EURO|nr:uncharacterized protein BO70DRAFT_358784 [Aspergillus heteromorphus CBS 117.55]PWY89761.1 hypothetical protein BO70DRAFT_358784 [Aspergillus heteromorphus CBS 117.55]